MNLQKPLDFIGHLKNNNNREWFNENKKFYIEAKNEFELFVETLIQIIIDFDPEIKMMSGKECMFRIFRDVRFSKNKSPYKTNFGAFINKGGRKAPYAGYYIHMESRGSFAGGGVYSPESKYLRAIRERIYSSADEYKKIINNKNFKKYFPELYGDKLKTAPRDFPKDFVDIELLKNKHYAVVHEFEDSFWTSEDIIDKLRKIFKTQYNFNKYINKAIKTG